MPQGWLAAVGIVYWVTWPVVLMLAYWFVPGSVNQSPEGATQIVCGREPPGRAYSATELVLRLRTPILSAFDSVNQRFPSGPRTIEVGSLLAVGIVIGLSERLWERTLYDSIWLEPDATK